MNLLNRTVAMPVIVASFTFACSSRMLAHAQDIDCSKELTRSTQMSSEQIRKQAQDIRELKQLVGDSDANVRLSALNSMLSSCNVAIREIAYETGFSSGDQAMRAITLKHKLFSMRQFIVEFIPPVNPTSEEKMILAYGLRQPIAIGAMNVVTGEFSPHGNIEGSVNGLQLQIRSGALVMRFQLKDDATLVGTGSIRGRSTSLPARIVLR